ncbi:M cell-type agglutination protein mam3-like [Chrysoperla carnea]|uniref:M cell-type agglutination protein mam3-like n=1 Tax=Chrysoperla carnea TaxID=189513 RepID=UPI001D069986|nr:M cell-type agglutination protein mam3-like [Chrysoperla carnea]
MENNVTTPVLQFAPIVNDKVVKTEQLKNSFSGNINAGNVSDMKKPMIISMEKFKSLMNNPNFHLKQKSINVAKTNSNTSPANFCLSKASSQVIKTYEKTSSPSKPATSEDTKNIESTSSSQDTINTSSHSTNMVENSSSVVQTPIKNQTFQIRLSNSEISSANSIKLKPQSTKIIKLNQNIQSGEEQNQTLHIQLNKSTVSSPRAVKIDPKFSKTIKLTQNGVDKSKPLLQSSIKNQSVQIQVSNPTICTSKSVIIDPKSLKTLKLTNNLQNGVEKSSPIAQTAANNPKTRVQVNNSPVTRSSAIKTVKLNQNVVEKTSPAAETVPKNKIFFQPPNNRFRIIHQNGKQIALPIVNKAPNNVAAIKPTKNVSISLGAETQNDKTRKIVTEDKNPFLKTPEHVYEKFNLLLPSKSTESSKTIEKPQKLETSSKVGDSTNIIVSELVVNNKVVASTNIKLAASENSKVNQMVANNVMDHANEKHDQNIGKRKRMPRKRINIDYDSGNSNGTPVDSQTESMLFQTLKSKFVPLVGHACTATIIDHLNLAYSRCRTSQSQAVRDLIQYIYNYERYRDLKKKNNNVINEKSTQTKMCEYTQLKENPILWIHFSKIKQ